MNPQYINRDSLLFDCEMAHHAIDLIYFPRRVGVLVIFIASAFNHSVSWSVINSGLLVWFILWVILRPKFIYVQSRTRLAEVAGLLQLPMRWFVYAICSGYLWYAELTPALMGWGLFILFAIDTVMTFVFEVPKFTKVEVRIAYLKTLPSIIEVTEETEHLLYI